MKCTCGAKSVSSSVHISYCDVAQGFTNEAQHLMKKHLDAEAGTILLYAAKDMTAKETAFRSFKNFLKNSWLITSEMGDSSFIFFANHSEVHFVNQQTCPNFKRFNPHGVFVEDSDEIDETMKEANKAIPHDGFTVVVKTNGKIK